MREPRVVKSRLEWAGQRWRVDAHDATNRETGTNDGHVLHRDGAQQAGMGSMACPFARTGLPHLTRRSTVLVTLFTWAVPTNQTGRAVPGKK